MDGKVTIRSIRGRALDNFSTIPQLLHWSQVVEEVLLSSSITFLGAGNSATSIEVENIVVLKLKNMHDMGSMI